LQISGQNDEEFKGFLIHAKKGADGDFFGEFSIPVIFHFGAETCYPWRIIED
jgi:hypothetical protein